MKVLGIVGSARKGGNTEIMIEEALAAAREAGAETDMVTVAGKDIKGCDGCDTCRKTGICHIKDDMQPIYKKMEEADAILLGSPVYFYGVTAQTKAIMDRTILFRGNDALKGKVAAPIIAVRRIGEGLTRMQLWNYFMAQSMIPARGAIGYALGRGEVRTGYGVYEDSSATEDARAAGKEVVQMVRRFSENKG